MSDPTGPVPDELIRALGDPDGPHEGAVLDTALGWDPELMVTALLRAMADADLPRRRRLAWVVKQTLDRPRDDLRELAGDPDQDGQVRRFLLEGLARFGRAGEVEWADVAELVTALRADPDPRVREGAAGLAGSLGPNAGQRQLLIDFLADSAVGVILTAAAGLQGHGVRADELDDELLVRLRSHPRQDVRYFVRELLGEN